MALIGEVTGSGGLTVSGSAIISGSGGLQLSQQTGNPTIVENMGGAVFVKEASGTNKLYFSDGSTVTDLMGLAAGVANTFTATNTFDSTAPITASGGILIADADAADKGVQIGTGGDLDIYHDGTNSYISNATGDLKILSTVNSADAIFIEVDGGTSETITIHSDQGTSATEGAASIQLLSDVGGINIKSGLNNSNAILLTADGGTSETIAIHADQGTGASSIGLTSDAGGITLTAGTGINLASKVTASNGIAITGSIFIGSSLVNAGADTDKFLCVDTDGEVRFRTGAELASDAGAVAADANITFSGKLSASNGMVITGDAFVVNDAVLLSAGTGRDLNIYHDGTDSYIDSGTGDLKIQSSVNSGASIYLHADGGVAESIKIHTDRGTSATSINLLSDDGGIKLNAGTTLSGSAVGINLTSTQNDTDCIYIRANGGTGEMLKIHSDQGTSVTEGAASLQLTSDAGGIGLRSTANLANAINITSDGGTTGAITVFNDQGTSVTEGASSIQLLTDAGGVELKSTANLAKSIKLIADGGTDETIYIQADQGTGADSIHLLSDAGGITLEATAVTVTAQLTASNGIAITGSVNFGASLVNAGADTDKFLCVDTDGELKFRTGAELASDAGAVAADANITFSGKLTASNGFTVTGDALMLADGVVGYIGTGGDLAMFHNGTDSIIQNGTGDLKILSTVNSADAIFIEVDGGTSETITIHSDQGTSVTEGASSIQLLSDAGGVELKSTANLAKSIKLIADGGTDETIYIQADQGTGADSIHLLSDAGGITLEGTAVTVTAQLTASSGIAITGSVHFGASLVNAGADTDKFLCVDPDGELRFRTGAELASDTGAVAADANITFSGKLTASNGLVIATSDDGLMMADGIPIYVGAGGDLSIFHNGTDSIIQNGTGDLNILSTVNSAQAIFIEADGGTDETIVIHADQGTGEGNGNASIELVSDAGGICFTATGLTGVMTNGNSDAAIQAHAAAGGIGVRSTANLAGSIQIESDGGTDETIVIHSDQGTGEGNANASIELVSDVGGICFTATGLTGVMTDTNSDAAIQAHAAAGGIGLRTTSNLAGAIQIEADGGTSETIVIHSDQGTGKWKLGTDGSSIRIVSDVGGVSIDAPSLNVAHAFSTDALTNAFGTDGDTCGTIIKYSPGADDTLTVGQLYFFHTDGTWNQCDADAVATGGKQLLGIGLGSARTVGVLIKGFVRIPNTEILNVPGSNASPGLPVYVSTTAGHLDFTAPSGNGDIVRIVGYAIQDDTDVLIYFDPDPTYVEVSA